MVDCDENVDSNALTSHTSEPVVKPDGAYDRGEGCVVLNVVAFDHKPPAVVSVSRLTAMV